MASHKISPSSLGCDSAVIVCPQRGLRGSISATQTLFSCGTKAVLAYSSSVIVCSPCPATETSFISTKKNKGARPLFCSGCGDPCYIYGMEYEYSYDITRPPCTEKHAHPFPDNTAPRPPLWRHMRVCSQSHGRGSSVIIIRASDSREH